MQLEEESQTNWLLVTALLGFVGASLMFVGDLMLYAHWGQLPIVKHWVALAVPARVSILLASDELLIWSTLLGPLATCFSLFGAYHMYLCIPRHRLIARLVGILAAAGFVFSGAYHAQFGIFGQVIKFANQQAGAPDTLLSSVHTIMAATSNMVSLCLFLAFLIFVVATANQMTHYPRWLAIFTPFVPVVVGVSILSSLSLSVESPYSGILAGASYNLMMILYFAWSYAYSKQASNN